MDRAEVVIETTTVKELTQKQALYQYWHTTRAEKRAPSGLEKLQAFICQDYSVSLRVNSYYRAGAFICLREILYLDELIFLKRVEKVPFCPLIPTQMFDFCDRGRKSLAF